MINRLENIGLNIRNSRKSRKLTQIELSIEVGIDRSYLSEIENGKVNPSIALLYAIADALQIQIIDLFTENH